MTSRTSFDAALAGRADTIVSRFLDRAARDPERVVFTVFPMGALNALGTLTWGDWASRARNVSGALLAQRLGKGARVAVYASNRELWPIALLGAAMSGAITVMLSPDATKTSLMAELQDCSPSVVIVDTIARLKLVRQVQAESRQTFTIVCDDLDPLRTSTAESLFEWEAWLKSGALALETYESLRQEFAERVDWVVPGDIIAIAYKPGTSVGVMYLHEAASAMAVTLTRDLNMTLADRIAVARSFSGVFECALGVFAAIHAGASVALVESVSDALRAARLHESTIVCGSEDILLEMNDHLRRARMNQENPRASASLLVGAQCHTMVCVSEGLATESECDLHGAGITLATFYGIPEHALICRNGPDNWYDDSIGEPVSDAVRVDYYGQLQVRRGPMSAVGYYCREDEFQRQCEPDGSWLRTGDRVEQLEDGALRLVGRMADLIKLPGGVSTSTDDIEAALCSLPYVAHAVCHGAHDKPLVAVLSLRRKEVERWARVQGIVAPWAALVDHPLVYDELANGIARINALRDQRERVRGFAPRELEFNIHTGELDQAGHINRAVLLGRFEHVFADLHNRLRY
ncbi:MAG: AMP-binding protein [Phycisphaerae bacterium]|nr:AMP-binding protein [Gemmatimonadaceae bacterium]